MHTIRVGSSQNTMEQLTYFAKTLWSGVSPNEILFCPILCCLVAYPCARIFPVLPFTVIPGLHYSISTGQYRNLLCGWSPKDESQRRKRSSSGHLVWTSDPYLRTASVKSAWVPSPTISQAAIQEARRRLMWRRRIQVLTTNGPTPYWISSEHRTWGRSHSAYPVYGEHFRFEFSVQDGRNKFRVYDRWYIHSTYFSISLIAYWTPSVITVVMRYCPIALESYDMLIRYLKDARNLRKSEVYTTLVLMHSVLPPVRYSYRFNPIMWYILNRVVLCLRLSFANPTLTQHISRLYKII